MKKNTNASQANGLNWTGHYITLSARKDVENLRTSKDTREWTSNVKFGFNFESLACNVFLPVKKDKKKKDFLFVPS